MSQPEDLVTGGEAATLARVTTDTIRRWRREGRLEPAGRLPGGRWLYRRSDVLRVIGAEREAPEVGIVRAQLRAFLARRNVAG